MDEVLFRGRYSLFDLIHSYPQQLAKDVEQADRNAILNGSPHDMTELFISKYFLDVPKLRRDEAHLLPPQDVQIDVSHDHRRFFREPGPHYQQGTLYTLVVPFDGDPDLFAMAPSTSFMSGISGHVKDHSLTLT